MSSLGSITITEEAGQEKASPVSIRHSTADNGSSSQSALPCRDTTSINSEEGEQKQDLEVSAKLSKDKQPKQGKNKNLFWRKSKSSECYTSKEESGKETLKLPCSDTGSSGGHDTRRVPGFEKQFSTPEIDGPRELVTDMFQTMTVSDDHGQEGEETGCLGPSTAETSPVSSSAESSNASGMTCTPSSSTSDFTSDSSEIVEPPPGGAKQDIIIIHTDDDVDQAVKFKAHLMDLLQELNPTIKLQGNYKMGVSEFKIMEGLADEFRYIFVYTESLLTEDSGFTQTLVDMLQADGLRYRSTRDNPWRKVIPVASTKQYKLPFSLVHLRPLCYWQYLERSALYLESYKTNLLRLIQSGRTDNL